MLKSPRFVSHENAWMIAQGFRNWSLLSTASAKGKCVEVAALNVFRNTDMRRGLQEGDVRHILPVLKSRPSPIYQWSFAEFAFPTRARSSSPHLRSCFDLFSTLVSWNSRISHPHRSAYSERVIVCTCGVGEDHSGPHFIRTNSGNTSDQTRDPPLVYWCRWKAWWRDGISMEDTRDLKL